MAKVELDGDEGRNLRDEATLTAPEKTDMAPLSGNAPPVQGNGPGQGASEEEAKPPRAGVMTRLGLDLPTLALMFKGSLPPVIAIAIYQSTPVAQFYGNLGYLMAIVSVLSLAVLPRGKFIQTLLLNVLAVCVGTGSLLLILWSSIQARLRTAPPGPTPTVANPQPYNSSQAAVCGIWLFFNIWLVNLVRAKLPAFNMPVILYSILVNIGATQGAIIPTVAAAEAFAKQIFLTMLSGIGLAAGVSLLVFPLSGRDVAFGQSRAALGLMRGCIKAQKKYLTDLEDHDLFATTPPSETRPEPESASKTGTEQAARSKWKRSRLENQGHGAETASEQKDGKALVDMVGQLRALGGKMHADLSFAKREIAWCKLNAKDLGDMYTLFRAIYIPVLGMTTVVDIFNRAAQRYGWDVGASSPAEAVERKVREKEAWRNFMVQMHGPFAAIAETMDEAIEHAGYMLEIVPRPKVDDDDDDDQTRSPGDDDVEARGADGHGQGQRQRQRQSDHQPRPGELGFANVVKEQVDLFYNQKIGVLRTWIQERRRLAEEEQRAGKMTPAMQHRAAAQLYIVLYVEKLILAASVATHKLASFADDKVRDGTMSRRTLVFPSPRRLHRWLLDLFSKQDSSGDQAPDILESRLSVVYMGDSYNEKRDPEHLPPTNAWQRLGDVFRTVPDLVGSDESFFAFRVACATMTIAIVAYLEPTQTFFIQQRLVWAMIIVALGMTPTSGQSIFSFLLRVGGTVIAMVAAFVIWYIADQKTAGVLVFLWLFTFAEYYFFVKFPRLLPVTMIAIVTQALIIGYELQVKKIGEAAAASTGQPFYPTYILAPYRLATVVAGCFVAFFWTVFPKPSTERTVLREDLSATLHLLGLYFSVINTALKAELREEGGDIDVAGSPAHQLRKIRGKLYSKLMLLLPGLGDHAAWQKWEPRIGGRFPLETYEEIIRRSTSILDYLTLMSYSLTWKPVDPERKGAEQVSRVWLSALREVLACISPMHQTVLSTLALLSNSLLSGRALPPFMPLPEPYDITRQVLELNPTLKEAGHVNAHEESTRMAASSSYNNDDRETAGTSGNDNIKNNKNNNKNNNNNDNNNNDNNDNNNDDDDDDDDNNDNDNDVDRISAEEDDGSPLRGRDLLNPDNMEQPGYTEFAVMQVCGTLICGDLEELVRCVSSLVGVVDFSFRVDISSGDSLTATQTPDSQSDDARRSGDEGLRKRSAGKGRHG